MYLTILILEVRKMKNLKQIVSKIQTLKNAGTPDETIQTVLELEESVSEVLELYEIEKNQLNVTEVTEELTKKLPNETWSKQKITIMLRDSKKEDILQPIKKNPPKRIGYRVNRDVLDAYIAHKLITKEELLLENKKLKETIEQLKQEVEALKANRKEEVSPKKEETATDADSKPKVDVSKEEDATNAQTLTKANIIPLKTIDKEEKNILIEYLGLSGKGSTHSFTGYDKLTKATEKIQTYLKDVIESNQYQEFKNTKLNASETGA